MTSTLRGSIWRLSAALLALTFGAWPAVAQHYGLREVRDVGSFGVNLAVGAPVGDFARTVDVAGGADLFGAFNIDRSGVMAIRIEGSYLEYGNDHVFIPQQFFPLTMSTTYSIVTAGIGPQLTLGRGPVRMYGFGTVGFSYVSARSSFGPDGCGCFPSQTDFDDWTGALQGGGGLLFTLRSRGTPIALDLGARYLYSGFADYVAPGDVQPQPNGDLVVFTSRARPSLAVFHLGVSIGIR